MAKARATEKTLEELESEPHALPTVQMAAPLGKPERHSYLNRSRCRIDVTLQGPEAERFNRIRAGLLESRASFPNGKPIVSPSDALKWLLLNAVEA